MQSEATQVLELLDKYEAEVHAQTFQPADDVSIQAVLAENIREMRDLLGREDLTTEEYHQLKKLSREMGALFMYMAEDAKWKPKGFHIYRTASEAFFQINDLMAKTNYTYSSQVSDEEDAEERVIVSKKIKSLLTKCIDHIGLAPASYEIEIDTKEAWWMINNAKEYYFVLFHIYEYFWKLETGKIDEQSMDYATLLEDLKILKDLVRVAKNAFQFLDVSHQVPESFNLFMQKIEQVIEKAEIKDFAWFKAEAHDLVDIFYHSSSPLEKWNCTDQHSFNRVLETNLLYLGDFQTEVSIPIDRANEIIGQIQAFRDLINLHRQNGLFHKADSNTPHIAIVYFDALEERADALLDELREAIEGEASEVSEVGEVEEVNEVYVTPTMIRNAEFIKSRVLTP